MNIIELKERLRYDPVSGLFTWVYCTNPTFTGKIAGSVSGMGYIYISFDNKNYKGHRLAWFYVTGSWPTLIDHINGDKTDNRWANLREVSNAINTANKRFPERELPRGVTLLKNCKPPQYWARAFGKTIGRYYTAEEASKAYVKAFIELNGVNPP